ncbi:MAG: ParB/RepB/Spo0J family partition protein [Gammaproteobacteria bacterium]|nr:ParB/RepB/Spo0J family partition protein [Gammaproteobacteria bacterium]
MKQKRALGRGLDALLGIGAEKPDPGGKSSDALRIIPIDLIQRGRFQPRLSIKPEALQELADSIKAQGIVQPIVVRPLPDSDRFELIAGERRWRAAQIAGLHEMPAVVKSVPDRAVMSIALIENIQREQLNPLEEALALHRLLGEFGMTHQEIAEAIGRSRAGVSNLLRLLDLGAETKSLLEDGQLEMGHARALLAVPDPGQSRLAKQVVQDGLSVRATERLVRHALATPIGNSTKAAPDPNVQQLETQLAERLGAAVAIKYSSKGRGQLVIHYNSLDELDGILAHIR